MRRRVWQRAPRRRDFIGGMPLRVRPGRTMPSPCPAEWYGRNTHLRDTPRALRDGRNQARRGAWRRRPSPPGVRGAAAVRAVTQARPSRGSGLLRRGRSYKYRVVRPGRGAAPCRRIRGIPHSGSGPAPHMWRGAPPPGRAIPYPSASRRPILPRSGSGRAPALRYVGEWYRWERVVCRRRSIFLARPQAYAGMAEIPLRPDGAVFWAGPHAWYAPHSPDLCCAAQGRPIGWPAVACFGLRTLPYDMPCARPAVPLWGPFGRVCGGAGDLLALPPAPLAWRMCGLVPGVVA